MYFINKMESSGEIYLITNKINGKYYIGQTLSISKNGRKHGTSERWKEHCYNATKRNRTSCPVLENAIRKHGKETFFIECVLKCDYGLLNYYEKKFISTYDCIAPKGYNLQEGGDGFRHHN